jgi:hypothetical protein
MTNKTETLLGGSDFEVLHLDGTKAVVRVRQIPVRLMPRFLEAQGDEAKMIEIATGMSPESVDALAPDSHETLVVEIERVNSDFFLRWVERQKARAERLMPGVLQDRISSASPTSPPKSP